MPVIIVVVSAAAMPVVAIVIAVIFTVIAMTVIATIMRMGVRSEVVRRDLIDIAGRAGP